MGRAVHKSNERRRYHGWRRPDKFFKFVPPDAPKMHPLVLYVLRFFGKTWMIFKKIICSNNSYVRNDLS